MFIKKPLEPILNQKYLRKDETSDILDTFDAPMINVSAVNPIGQSGDKITLIGKIFDDEIEGRNIDFYDDSTYLGTGKTNKYGVGIFDYTCSGVGTKEIIGKWGDMQSEPYSIEDYLFAPKFDGTESVSQIQGSTTVNDGVMSGGSAFLTNGFDNTGNWILEAEVYIGYQSGIWITPVDTTARDTNQFLLVGSQIYTYEDGQYTLSSSFTPIHNSWASITITKNDNNMIFEVNNETVSVNWSIATSANKLSVGVDAWGGTSSIRNIKVKPQKKVELTASKSILSHTNSETSILTATLSTAQTGQVVELYDENDNYIADMTDNEDGTYSYTYHSQGAGNIGFYAKWGMILSETYDIKDAIYYNPNALSSSQTISIPDLPTNFKCEFKGKGTTGEVTDSAAWIEVGSDANNLILFGRTSSKSHTGIFVKVNGSYTVSQQGNSKYQSDDILYSYEYNNGSQSITDGTQTVTASNSQITNRNYVRASIGTNMYIKEILFLPL